jgi:hypothetical protein
MSFFETRTVDLFEALFEGSERGFYLGGERDGHGLVLLC